MADTLYVDITSDLNVKDPITVHGDRSDLFILRWDESPATPGFQGEVKISGGGGINPLGDLEPSNFINLAGGLNASGGGGGLHDTGGDPPDAEDLQSGLRRHLEILPGDIGGGGFFTGYWLTTGDPDKDFENASFSNAIIVGGWYTSATKFSMTSGTSGVYVAPPAALQRLQAPASGETSSDMLHAQIILVE